MSDMLYERNSVKFKLTVNIDSSHSQQASTAFVKDSLSREYNSL